MKAVSFKVGDKKFGYYETNDDNHLVSKLGNPTSMALRSLERYGLRLDELNRIRATDEEVDGHANDLKDHCDEFMKDINDFQRISDSFIGIFDHVSSAVEKEKVGAFARKLEQRVGTKCKFLLPWHISDGRHRR